jgi:putative membrane protein
LQSSWLSLVTYWEIPPWVTCALVAGGLIYIRGWLALRRTRPETLPVWRLLSFLAGVFAIFVAVSSPLDTYSETLLFMHMAQHFVLMSVAPPLIVLGCPFVPMLRGLPRSIVRSVGGPLFRSSLAHRLQGLFSQLPIAWLAMNVTYVGWHIPSSECFFVFLPIDIKLTEKLMYMIGIWRNSKQSGNLRHGDSTTHNNQFKARGKIAGVKC